jgi:hypothetical protein
MKKSGILIFLSFLVSIPLFCQKNISKNDILKAKEIVVYGLDFSNTIIIHESEKHVAIVENDYYPAFNDRFFVKEFNDLKTVIKANLIGNADFTRMLNLNHEKKYTIYDQTVISKIINEYNTPEKEGIGLIFIIKSFDKPNKCVELFPAFFDISTKQVIWTSEYKGTGGGYGLDTYWSEKLFDAIDHFIASYNRKVGK